MYTVQTHRCSYSGCYVTYGMTQLVMFVFEHTIWHSLIRWQQYLIF